MRFEVFELHRQIFVFAVLSVEATGHGAQPVFVLLRFVAGNFAFFDVGRTYISRRLPFETEGILMGAGVGVELQLKQNLDFRVDWGVALRDVPSRGVEAGSSRVYFVLSLAF